jgi:hypothetical protein
MKMKKYIIAIAGLFILLFSAVLYATSARISWTPARYAPWSITPGSATTTVVTFINLGPSSINGTKLSLSARGQVKDLITFVSPKFPQTIKKNESVSITLKVTAPNISGVKIFTGEIVLAESSPDGKTKDLFSATLPAEITVSPFSLPPEPDPSINNATLLGVDADENGVRDDTDRWIAFNAPNSAKERAALSQYAKGMQVFLRDANDKELSIRHSHEDKAADCMDYVLGLDEAIAKRRQSEAQILNTDLRSREYLKADAWLGGQVYEGTPTSELKSKCVFNPDSLPN